MLSESLESSGSVFEFTQSRSQSSSESWSTVEVQMEAISSVEVSSTSSHVRFSPRVLMELSDVQVESGEKAEFSCSFDGRPFIVVTWDHNGHELPDSERVRSSQSGGLLSLVIRCVGVADQGIYRCTATNQHGQNSSWARLTVEGALFFIFFSSPSVSPPGPSSPPPAAPPAPPPVICTV